uniref:Sushi domain-containing protein n=1 Tax=Hucho hucho TaxID=62062 RepID=A0A4W5M016_9TELE
MKGTNFTFGSKVTFSCVKGFVPGDPYEIQCEANLKWNSAPPVCQPVTCGEPPHVGNADFTLKGKTYLSTVIYSCAEGYRLGWNVCPGLSFLFFYPHSISELEC